MSAVTDDLQNAGGEGFSLESFYSKLYDEQHKKFHTEVQHPDGMTLADIYADYLQKHQLKGAGKILAGYQDWKRTNMVAYKRKRAGETVAIAQAQAEAEKVGSWREALTGLKR